MGARLSPLEIMRKLVSFPTISSETNLPLIDWVEGYLAEQGIDAHRWVDPAQPEKAALFAHVGPWQEGALVLSGHTDVVPVVGQAWDSDPFEVVMRDGRYFGRGTCDMKGFDALAIWALAEAHHMGIARPLQLALSFDEEVGCRGAPPMIAAMQQVLPKGSTVIVGEPSEMQAVTGHKGWLGIPTSVLGFEVHSSIAYQGVSAIHEAARLIQWANDVNEANAQAVPEPLAALFDPPYTSWHVGRIDGGTAENITARECGFLMGCRPVAGEDIKELERIYLAEVDALRARIQAVRPEADIVIGEIFDVPPLQPEPDGRAEALVRSITGDNGTHVVSYGTEAGQFQQAGYSAVVCGPGNIEQAHQPNEYISVAEFEAGHRFLRDLLKRLL